MNDIKMPTLEELTYAPELAAVAALDAALEVASRALIAAHPQVFEDQIPHAKVDTVLRAFRLLNMAIKLQVAVARYRQATSPLRPLHPEATDEMEEISLEEDLNFP